MKVECLRVGVWVFAAAICACLSAAAQDSKKAFSDAEFVKKAASDGLHEVELGKLAQERAAHPEVKNFGHHMVTDHTRANQELKEVARSASLTVPDMMMPKHQKEVEKLKDMRGAEFDRAYMEHMVKGHEKAVSLFQQASTEAKNAALKGFAAKTLPTLQKHLAEAKRVHQAVGK